ncbi:MAG: 3-oxoacyl-ACP synthase, partial [bacterium]|nr:3-oxoacyl-ACP synthase [Candidatus Colisoma equi]
MLKTEYYLPEKLLTNAELVKLYPEWTEEKIFAKTGIASRHVAGETEDVLAMAEKACRKLFAAGVNAQEIDFVLLCTQSPKYKLPSTACLLQDRLGLPKSVGALDFDLGCSGFVYGLAMAKGLVRGGIGKNVLLVTAETYTKYIGEMDKSTRRIFGDGASATLVDAETASGIGEFSLGTDGGGAEKLILKDGERLFMDGPEIFN